MIDIGNGLWNIRDSFLALGGIIDIGTHMSLIRLSTGKFLVVDTCAINDTDKALVSEMTHNGALIEAVIATHPFHTLFFEPFHKLYPNAPFYGTSRHLAKIKNVPWAGDIADNLSRWESEGIFMRIPAGADFVPSDESIHFSGIFLYHQPSRSLFNDDTILYFDHPGCGLRCLAGKRHGDSNFWYVDRGLHTADDAIQFRGFIESVLNDWDFDNLILAHTGNVIGGGKETLRKTLKDAEKAFQKLGAPPSGH
jgi:hypothetical protein